MELKILVFVISVPIPNPISIPVPIPKFTNGLKRAKSYNMEVIIIQKILLS